MQNKFYILFIIAFFQITLFLEVILAEEINKETPFHKLNYIKRRNIAHVPDIFTFLESAKYADTFGVLEVPAIGSEKDRNGKTIKYNAASPGHRHGDKDTELAFQLLILANEQKLREGTCVWIPVDKRIAFFEEGFYLVPLRVKREEIVKGNIKYFETNYDLLPTHIMQFPRLTKQTFRTFISTIDEWQKLATANVCDTLADEKVKFLKALLGNPVFEGLHNNALQELKKLGAFKNTDEFNQNLDFWCKLMTDAEVNVFARTEIQNILANKMQNLSVETALSILRSVKISETGEYTFEKNDSIIRNKQMLEILKKAFFSNLEDSKLYFGASQALAKTYHTELRKKLLTWLDDPKMRLIAVKAGVTLKDDERIANAVLYWYGQCSSEIENNNAERINEMQDKNIWLSFNDCFPYFFNKDAFDGEDIIRDYLLNNNYSFSDQQVLIENIISHNDNRFSNTIFECAKEISIVEAPEKFDLLSSAASCLCLFKNQEGIKLTSNLLKNVNLTEEQKDILVCAFKKAAISTKQDHTINNFSDCIEWVKGLEETVCQEQDQM